LGPFDFKEWGIGGSWIMWTMDFGRGSFLWNGPDIKKKLLSVRTREGPLHKIGGMCMDVKKFLDELEKMGVSVLREGDV
jgi:hypothetical protein